MKNLVALLILLLCLAGCTSGGADRAADVKKLVGVFPILEQYQVISFRSQDGHSAFEYARGAYDTDMRATSVSVLKVKPNRFDNIAQADFNTVKNIVEKTGIGVIIINGIEYSEGKLKRAVFDFSRGFTRQRYVYDPGCELPEDIPHEMLHTKVDADWYYVWEDWN